MNDLYPTDLMDREIKVGDNIAISARDGREIKMILAEVIEIDEPKQRLRCLILKDSKGSIHSKKIRYYRYEPKYMIQAKRRSPNRQISNKIIIVETIKSKLLKEILG